MPPADTLDEAKAHRCIVACPWYTNDKAAADILADVGRVVVAHCSWGESHLSIFDTVGP